MAGTDTWSLHADGRATDLGVTGASPGAGAGVLSMLLGAGAGVLQRIMFDHRVYDRQSPTGRPITGTNPHTDHLHVELSLAAALEQIPLWPVLEDQDDEEDSPVVLLRRLAAPQDGRRWMLSGSRRVLLPDWPQVQILMDAGVPTVSLSDSALTKLQEIN